MHSGEQRIYCLSKNFKHFLLDLFYIVRHNLAFRILNGSLSLLYTWRSALLSFSNTLLRDLRMLSLQILFSMAKSVACALENYIHVSRMGTSVPIASCCACPPHGHQTELELNTRAFAHIPTIPVGRTKECQQCAHILLQLAGLYTV